MTMVVAILPRTQLLPPCTRTLQNLRLRLTTVLWILSTNQKATRLEKKPAPRPRRLAARIARVVTNAKGKEGRIRKQARWAQAGLRLQFLREEGSEKCAERLQGCDKCASAKIAAIEAAVAKKAKSKKADDMPPMDAPAPKATGAEMGAPLKKHRWMLHRPKKCQWTCLLTKAQKAIPPLKFSPTRRRWSLKRRSKKLRTRFTHSNRKSCNESEEELDLAQVFNEDDMEEKVSALANEGDEHTAGNGEEFFAPSSAESLEASLDEPQMASMEDFFSLQGSDSDPLAHLIAGEIEDRRGSCWHGSCSVLDW